MTVLGQFGLRKTTGRTQSRLLTAILIVLTLSVVAAIQIVFVVTYPLNHGGGDNPNYFQMLLRGESNLINASGYPYLMSHLLRPFVTMPSVETYTTDFLRLLLLVHHGVHFILIVACVHFFARAFGAFVAIAAGLAWGATPFFLSQVTATSPEWLQADLLALTAATLCAARMDAHQRRKFALYAGAAFVFAWSFLVKFNALPLALMFPLLLLTEPMSWKSRFAAACASSVVFTGVVVGYALLFQLPMTGTVALNHDRGWLLSAGLALKFDDAAFEKSSGIDALRLRSLAAVLPPGRDRAGPYRTLSDIAPPDVRARYRPIYDRIMSMSKSDLLEFVATHPLPPVAWFDQVQKTNVTVNPAAATTVNSAAGFSLNSAAALSAVYSSSPPTSWTSGQAQSYSVTVTNAGSQPWNATGNDKVVLGVHFGTNDDTPGVGWATEQRFTMPTDLAPGQSVTLSVAVTAPGDAGAYVLRHRMLKEFVAWFDQIQKTNVTVNSAAALSAVYSSSPPTSWTSGQAQSYSVTVTNAGSQPWNATGNDKVVLGVHFGTNDDTPGVGWATEQRFTMPTDLAPGQSVTLSVAVTAPGDAGAYVLRHRMLKEVEADSGTAAVAVYYYVGIPEGDDLGTRLYVEYVASHLSTFTGDVLSRSLNTSFIEVARPRVLLSDGLPGIELGPVKQGWRSLTLTSGAGWHPTYWSRGAVLWEPGRVFFGWLDALKPAPLAERSLYLFVLLALLSSKISGLPQRPERDLVATIVCGVVAYVVAANVVLFVRPVETAAVWPLVCLTWAVGLKWLYSWIRRLAIHAEVAASSSDKVSR